MQNIDNVKSEAQQFYDKYSKDLKNRELFHEEIDKSKSENPNKPKVNEKLSEEMVEDIRFGA